MASMTGLSVLTFCAILLFCALLGFLCSSFLFSCLVILVESSRLILKSLTFFCDLCSSAKLSLESSTSYWYNSLYLSLIYTSCETAVLDSYGALYSSFASVIEPPNEPEKVDLSLEKDDEYDDDEIYC